AVVGNMGTAQRMDYSVLGDTINTGSRLEGQSKTYGVDIVLGPNTWARVPDFATIELDIIQVKGKKVGLHVYALMGDPEMAKRPDFIKLKETVDKLMSTYRSQKWDEAEAIIAELRVIGEPFHMEYLCELYEGRIAAYRIEPPAADWDGVFIATSK
ncbi:MAG: adenylate/guanylate cyclase protein, partial [Rhodospirillales bacterium]|nr:adenylate/guanylate cyclase protein [Rhodospirillales bacterium]